MPQSRPLIAVCIFFALMACLGSFLPWTELGLVSVAGTSGDGVFTLILSIAVLIMVGILYTATEYSATTQWTSSAAAVSGIVIAIIGIAAIFGLLGSVDETDAAVADIIGNGLYMVIAGGIGVALAGCWLAIKNADEMATPAYRKRIER